MRVLISNTGPWGTGSGTVADAVLRELEQKGHEVKAIFPDSGLPGEQYDKYYQQPEKYHIVPFPASINGTYLYTFPLIIPDPNPRNFENAWTFKRMSARELQAYFLYMNRHIKQVINHFQPDVIECQHIWAIDHLIGQLGYQYISVAHHSDQLGFIYDPRMAQLAKKSAHEARYIFAISDYVKKEVGELYGVNEDKIITIPNGYNSEIFKPLPVERRGLLKEFNLPAENDMEIITFCGKISRTKGIDILLQANQIIQRQKPVMILVLGGGSLTQFNEQEKAGFSLKNVYFLGHRSPEDLARLHNIARLSVLPSRTEGFGIAALEAMACGLPVVATRTGGLQQFVVGELVEVERVDLLAQAILKILDLPAEPYSSLVNQARQKASQYSWPDIVEKRLEYYTELAEENQWAKQWHGTRYYKAGMSMPIEIDELAENEA